MLLNKIKEFCNCQKGGVAIYATFSFMMMMGATSLVVDYGRMVVLKNQMQNLADSAAAAGAMFLNEQSDSITNATTVIHNAISKKTSLSMGSGNLSIQSIVFYDSNDLPTTDPVQAIALSVNVHPEDVGLIFYPLMEFLTETDGTNTREIDAFAKASPSPLACAVPPLMLCDFSESMGQDYDILNPANIGKQVRLGQASGLNTLAPGNFGVLDTPSGSQASQDIAEAMAAVTPAGCYGKGIDTAPGARADAVRDGINARFDIPAPPHNFPDPAPNVINYNNDANIDSSFLGNGNWDVAGYWSEKHPDATYPTATLGASPSRYQVYLYELGETFAVNGKKTIYPAPAGDYMPSGYSLVTSQDSPGVPSYGGTVTTGKNCKGNCNNNDYSDYPDYDGVPSHNPPVEDPRRRIVQAVILECSGDNVKGNGGPYPSRGKYVELFVTQSVNSDNTIYAEVLRKINPANSTNLRANVKISN